MQRFHYTIKQKIQILEEVKDPDMEGSHPVSKKQLQNWSVKKEKFQSLSPLKQQKTLILHPGPCLKYDELYSFLYTKVKEMRSERQAINHNFLIAIALEEMPELANPSAQGQRSLINRFMKFSDLSIRTITSFSSFNSQQMDPEEAQRIQTFKTEYFRIIDEFGILENDIFNMDQSGLYYDTPPKRTIEIIGSQQVCIAPSGGEKKRITIISLINCSGMKYRQQVIFKGVPGARVEKEVKVFNDETNCFFTQENAWTDKTQLENWLNFVWYPIAEEIKRPKLLILDSLFLHKDLKVNFEKFNTIVLFIPAGLTWTLQPLDSLYHRTYKSYARDCFIVNQTKEMSSEEERRKQVIENVKEIHGKITEEIVRMSWKQVGLNYPIEQGMIIEEEEARQNEDPSMLIEDDDNLFS